MLPQKLSIYIKNNSEKRQSVPKRVCSVVLFATKGFAVRYAYFYTTKNIKIPILK